MVKRIIIVALSVVLLFVIGFFSHSYILQETLSFSLLNVYIFHTIAAILVYLIIEFVAEQLPTQAGYAYLMLMFFKIGAFVLLFQTSVFAKDALTQAERIGLVVPLFLFLIAEAIAVAKLLNSK